MNRIRRVILTVLPFIVLTEYAAIAAWWWPFGDLGRRWVIPFTPRKPIGGGPQ